MKKNKIIVLLLFGFFFYRQNSCMDTTHALFYAIEKDDKETVAQIIDKKPSRIHKFYNYQPFFYEKVTSLHVAAYHGRNKCLKMLLEKKQSGCILTERKYSPLHFVKNLKAARLLYKYGAPVAQEAENGSTPFMHAVENNLFDVAEFLLEKDAHINRLYGRNPSSVLHTVVILRQPAAVEFLLAHNANPHQQDALGRTPFDMVVQGTRNIKEIRQVFEKYGMVFFPDMDYKTLFQNPQLWDKSVNFLSRTEIINHWARLFASVKQGKEVTNNAMPHGIMVNEYGCIAYHISYQTLEKLFGIEVAYCIQSLLRATCNGVLTLVMKNKSEDLRQEITLFPFVVSYDPDIAQKMMMEALGYSDGKCLNILLENKINCHQRVTKIGKETCNFNGTYVHQAVFCNNTIAIDLLIKSGVDCLLRDQQGLTPIEYARELERYNCVAQLNRSMNEKLIEEFHKNNYKVCKQLLSQISDYNINLGNKRTLLQNIIHHENFGLLTLLLRYGAIVTKQGLDLCLERYPTWKGTALLKDAYDQQEQKKREKQQEIEAANKEIASRCCVCFESKQHMQDLPCKNHEDIVMCDGCCQELKLHNMDQSCLICREKL